jgi:transcriptional regulator with GAF, ATPase, and Fis domain
MYVYHSIVALPHLAGPVSPLASFGDELIARDPAMLRVLETAEMVARHRGAVLIAGETGSGKEVIARVLHRCSDRSSRPWIDVNCAALPEHLVESELFGHERGAFSGADTAKPGLFEMASGGTLFLDEIGEIDPRVQVKLLRVLDSAPFYRLGGTRKVSVDVRLIAATNRDLDAAVHAGSFRRDLYHRITELQLYVPPLRSRPLDIVALAAHFLGELDLDRHFTEEALEMLTLMKWPGNVRELRNFVTRLAMSGSDGSVSADDIRRCATSDQTELPARSLPISDGVTSLSALERLVIVHTLEATGGNQTLAAQQLGIPRRTFCRRLNEYQIALGRQHKVVLPTAKSLDNCRTELRVPVEVKATHGSSVAAQSCDLSLGGMGVSGVSPSFVPLSEVKLRFTLPDQEAPIEVLAAMVWHRPDGTAGLRFTRLSAATQERIRHWLSNSTQLGLRPVTSELPQPLTA